DLAGEHEERHCHQWKAVGAVDQVLRDDLRVHHVQMKHEGNTADEQRERDRHSDRHRAEQREQEHGNGHGRFPFGPDAWWLPCVVASDSSCCSASISATLSDSFIWMSSSSAIWPRSTRHRSFNRINAAEMQKTMPTP